jgi:DNA-binding PadR family transcriptional regulator
MVLRRMTPQVFHILLALADGQRHGYGIILEVARHTGDRIRLGTGTLYTAISRLVDAGWIAESGRRPGAGDDARRRYYGLTDAGREALRAESERLDAAVAVARQKRVLRAQPSRPRRG